jgi:hypothetical protein
MIQNACNLRYKDAYTSCYICHAECKKCIKESYTYATKELPHTKLTNHRLLEGRQKGLDTTGKRALRPKSIQSSPYTHGIGQRAKQTKWLDQGHTLEGHKFTYLYHFFRNHSSLSTIPESDVPPGHHRGMRPESHPRYQPNVLRASHLQLKPSQERAIDSTLGLVPKVSNQCRAISSKVGLATFILPCLSILRSILSNLSNLEPPWENHSYLIGGVRVPRKKDRGP